MVPKERGATTQAPSLASQHRDFVMKELSFDQVNEVSGGSVPILLAVAGAIYHERNEIADFVGGVLDGFNGTSHMEPK